MAMERVRSVTQLVAVLTRGHGTAGAGTYPSDRRPPLDLLAHSLQAAHEAYLMRPDDEPLQIAALVHDIGLLVDRTDDGERADHAVVGARAIASLLGHRVERLVALHVEAKRYLAAADQLFAASLSGEARRVLEDQGGPMTLDERITFEALAEAHDAVLLAVADQQARQPARQVPSLVSWLPILHTVAATAEQDAVRSDV